MDAKKGDWKDSESTKSQLHLGPPKWGEGFEREIAACSTPFLHRQNFDFAVLPFALTRRLSNRGSAELVLGNPIAGDFPFAGDDVRDVRNRSGHDCGGNDEHVRESEDVDGTQSAQSPPLDARVRSRRQDAVFQ